MNMFATLMGYPKDLQEFFLSVSGLENRFVTAEIILVNQKTFNTVKAELAPTYKTPSQVGRVRQLLGTSKRAYSLVAWKNLAQLSEKADCEFQASQTSLYMR